MSSFDDKRMLRVMHFITAIDYSGAPTGVLELIRQQLTGTEIQVVLVSLNLVERRPDLPEGLTAFIELGRGFSVRRPLEVWRTSSELRRYLKEYSIDILHSHLPSADAIAALAAAGTRSRHLAHIRGTPPWLSSTKLRNRYKRWFMRMCFATGRTTFASVSKDAADYYRHHLLGKSRNVYNVVNGVDVSSYRGGQIERSIGTVSVVGSAGRLSVEKNFQLLISVIARLRRSGIDLKLRLAGEGGLRDRLLAQACEEGIEDSVEMCGVVEDMSAFYETIDLFVLPSRSSEGLPRVLIEAGACGTPVVATDVGGTRELVQDGETGILVPSDDIEAMAGAIESMVRDHGFRERVRRAAWRKVEMEFSTERVAAEVRAIYRSLG